MSRRLYIGALLLTALLAPQVFAQKAATVENVVVRGSADAMEVEIQTSGSPVSPNTQALAGPDRIVIDFPGARPSAVLRAKAVNRGALKGVRSGLFFSDPPITRIVLDLTGAQPYRISTTQNAVVVKLGAGNAAGNRVSNSSNSAAAQLRDAAFVSDSSLAAAGIKIERVPVTKPSATSASDVSAQAAAVTGVNIAAAVPEAPAEPPKPAVTVSYENGMLSIRTEKATLSQVLYEVQLKTQAEIAIPAGAEREQVVTNLGPGPARDVLGALLQGSPYNFIFVGNELSLQRVILTRREADVF